MCCGPSAALFEIMRVVPDLASGRLLAEMMVLFEPWPLEVGMWVGVGRWVGRWVGRRRVERRGRGGMEDTRRDVLERIFP
jgi:hypothetical protein